MKGQQGPAGLPGMAGAPGSPGAVGEKGKLEEVGEVRCEILCVGEGIARQAVEALKQ